MTSVVILPLYWNCYSLCFHCLTKHWDTTHEFRRGIDEGMRERERKEEWHMEAHAFKKLLNAHRGNRHTHHIWQLTHICTALSHDFNTLKRPEDMIWYLWSAVTSNDTYANSLWPQNPTSRYADTFSYNTTPTLVLKWCKSCSHTNSCAEKWSLKVV